MKTNQAGETLTKRKRLKNCQNIEITPAKAGGLSRAAREILEGIEAGHHSKIAKTLRPLNISIRDKS